MYSHKNGMTLRKIEQSDLSTLLMIKQESWWGTHRTLIANSQDQQKWFNSLDANTIVLIVTDSYASKKNGGVCVISDIDWIGLTASLSGSVYKSHRISENTTRGFASALDFCFEMLNMHRVECQVLETNYASQKLLVHHLGMKLEGKRRQAVYKSGHYCDSLIFGMLRNEWSAHPRVINYGGSCNTTYNHDLARKLVLRSRKYIQSFNVGSEP